MKATATLSPTATLDTSGPTAVTTPEPSCPPITGNIGLQSQHAEDLGRGD